MLHEAALYDKAQTKEFMNAVDFQVNRLIESMAALITKIKTAKPTTDKIAIQSGEGVDSKQKEEDLRTAIETAHGIMTMRKTILVDKADAETAALASPKYKFELKQAPAVAADLKQAYDKIMSLAPRKKAYKATDIWEPKKSLNVDRRLFNLRDLFTSYLDGDDRKMLSEIQKVKSSLLYRLMVVADQLDSLGFHKQADDLDQVRVKLITG